MSEPEYAPQLTARERLTQALRYGIFAFGFLGLAHYVILPWYRGITAQLGCNTFFGQPDYVVLIYSLYVGIPFMLFLIYCAVSIPKAIAIHRHRQFPLPGRKTLYRTRIRRGKTAIFISYLMILPCFLIFAFTIWCGIQTHAVIANIHTKHPHGITCNPSD